MISDASEQKGDTSPLAIITPYYNTGALFRETVESVLQQTLQSWEWVIVNDGTTDAEALAVLEPLRDSDPRIRVIDQPNRGLPAARNVGVAETSAPFLFFLDSDDLLDPTALEKLLWLLFSDPRPAFATAWHRGFGARSYAWRRGFETRTLFLRENTATPLSMVRRSVFEAVGGFDESRTAGLEDYEFWLCCAAHGFWGRDLPELLLHQRHKTAQEYRGYSWPVRDDAKRLSAFHQQMQELYPSVYQHGLPQLPPLDQRAFVSAPTELPFQNRTLDSSCRVLLLLPHLSPGGVSSVALAIIKALREQQIVCTVVTTMPDAHERAAEFEQLAEVFIPEHFVMRWDRPRFLRYLIESRGIDTLLLSDFVVGYQLLPFLRAFCPKVRVIDYVHMLDPESANNGQPGFSVAYAEQIDLHVATSAALSRWMIERGVPAECNAVVYAAVDPQRWKPDPEARVAIRAEHRLSDERPLILFAGRLVAQKQPRLALRVMHQLVQQGLSFHALIAGDGPDLPWLRRYIRRHRLESSVTLLGAVPHEQLPRLMAAADIFFLPSAYEGLAVVLFEALAVGVPVVSLDSPAQREIITPDCGVLVLPDAEQEAHYVAALTWLVRAPAQRQAMAQAARARALAHFDGQTLGSQWVVLFARAAELRQNEPLAAVSQIAGQRAADQAVEWLRGYERNRRLGRAVQILNWSSRWSVPILRTLRRSRERLSYWLYPLRVRVARLRQRWR